MTPSQAGAHFASNMKLLRRARGWSQQDVTDRMRELGWTNFHQTTVTRLEGKTRSVRLEEARDIAAIFGVTLDLMTAEPGSSDPSAAVRAEAAQAAIAMAQRGLATAEMSRKHWQSRLRQAQESLGIETD